MSQKKENELLEALITGYTEMSGLNLELAAEALAADEEAARVYAENLTECDG